MGNDSVSGISVPSFADVAELGRLAADSHFAPKDFKGRPGDCRLAMHYGGDLGLSPMQSLQSICVVNGRPSIFGDAAKAVCVVSPACEWINESMAGEGDHMTATCTAQRRGYPSPTVSTFSVADAKRAKLWGKAGPWTEYPQRMLQLRARGFCLRDAFPDVLRGLITVEEAGDYPHTAPPPAIEGEWEGIPATVLIEHKPLKPKSSPRKTAPAGKPAAFLIDEIGGWPDEVKAICRTALTAARSEGIEENEAILAAHARGLVEIERLRAAAAAEVGE
ncbi:hypothetical protein UFOVP1124_47 [uncultured Caudovirales phage]|uniref:RecT family n=1 Tax=uncultured Caudovirales phage TaxID=2100421 RepID=A0A6J5QQV6_9CAUD|nr:hypothetical protein UFOVP1124_47 [uncultured Caudovirales phage]